MTFLPESICEFSELVELGLSENRLEELPESFGNLVNLTKLNIGYCSDVFEQKCFSYDRGIDEFIDSQNRIFEEQFPIFSKLTNIQQLCLQHNGLNEVPSWVRCFKKLTHLSLMYNSLNSLPNWITGYPVKLLYPKI